MRAKDFLVCFYLEPEPCTSINHDLLVDMLCLSGLDNFSCSTVASEWVLSTISGIEQRISFIVTVDNDLLMGLEVFKSSFLSVISAEKSQFPMMCIGVISIELDPTLVNCGICEYCGAWVSNSDCKTLSLFRELSIGTIYQGQLLCDLCLPNDHPDAF